MKITVVLLAFGLVCACGQAPQANNSTANRSAAPSPSVAATPVIPKDGDYPAKGVVTKINTEMGSVEINHEDIPGVMPPMTMEFFVADKKTLTGLKIGDSVDFVLRYKHPTETIVSITKVK